MSDKRRVVMLVDYRQEECYERQIAALEEENRKLKAALEEAHNRGPVAQGRIVVEDYRCPHCRERFAIPRMDMFGAPNGLLPKTLQRWGRPGETACEALERAAALVEKLEAALAHERRVANDVLRSWEVERKSNAKMEARIAELEEENAKLKAALMEIAALNWSTYNAAYDLLADVQDIVKAALAEKEAT